MQRLWASLGVRTLLLWSVVQGISLTFPTTRFWDDYYYYPPQGIQLPKTRVPVPLRSTIDGLIFSENPALFRILTFLALPLIVYLFHRVLRTLPTLFSTSELKWMTVYTLLLFSICFSTMVIWTLFSYTVALVFFMLGWLSLLSNRVLIRWIAAPICFVVSFRLPSLISFLLVPLGHSVWLARRQSKALLERLVLGVFLISLGVLYLPVLKIFGYSFVAGYNEVTLSRALRGLLVMVLPGLPFLLNFHRYFGRGRFVIRPIEPVDGKVALGLIVTALALFPYLVTGHLFDLTSVMLPLVPGAGSFDGRHLILLPFGLAFLLMVTTALIQNLYVTRVRKSILLVLLMLGLSSSLEFKIDSLKQEAIIAELSKVPDLKSLSYIYFVDGLEAFNAKGRAIRSYEKAGWLNLAGGTQEVRVLDRFSTDCKRLVDGTEIRITGENLSRLRALLTDQIPVKLEFQQTRFCASDEGSN